MKTSLHVLHVEDSADDARLIQRELERSGYDVTFERVETAADFTRALGEGLWELILSDYAMPHFGGEAALRLLRESGLDLPFIFVSGTMGEDVAVAAMRAGAHDYVMKGNLARLGAAVGRELQAAVQRRLHREADAQLRMSEHKYRHLFTSMGDAALLIAKENDRVIDANDQAELLFGQSRDQLLGQASSRLFPSLKSGPAREAAHGTARSGIGGRETMAQRSDGTMVPVLVSVSHIQLNDHPFLLALFRDISALKESERQLRTLVEHSPDIILRFDRNGRYLFVNQAMEKITGVPVDYFIGRPIGEIAELRHGPAVAEKYRQMGASVNRVFTTGRANEEEMRLPMPAGELIFNLRLVPEVNERGVVSVLVIAREITARQRAEEALRASMARVVQQELALIALTKQPPLQSDDLPTALRRLTESSARALGVARVSLWRYQAGRQAIRCVDLFELPAGRHSEGLELAAVDYPAYFQALAECEVIAADEARTEPRTTGLAKDYLEPLGITSMMDIPVQLKGELEGVLCHEHIGPPRLWTSDERTFAIAIANLTALALEEWERRQAQEKLRQSQQAYASLVNTVDGIVWELDVPTFRFTFVSQQAERLLGYPASRWLDEPTFWQDHLHPDDRGWAADFCVTATREKRDHEFKYRMIAADGRVVWLHDLVTIVIENNLPAKLRGIMVDITESKRAEEALQSSEQRFRQVTENIDEVFWLTDPAKEQMIYISPRYARVWGRTCESLYARPQSWLEAVHPDDAARVRSATLSLAASGGYNLEYCILRPDGAVRWVHDRAFPIKDEAGRVYRIAGVAEDITARHQLEDQLRQAQKLESLGTLAGGIAHDFNNILTGVLGAAEVARLELPEDHPVSPWIQNITLAGNRARELVQQILTFGRKHETKLAPCKLQSVVQEALRLLHTTLPTMVRLDSHLDPASPAVIADDTHIHQVVMNLCTNAWQALPSAGGRIEVALAPTEVTAEQAARRLGLTPGPYALLTVRDNGSGMPPEVLSHIFEPFFTTKKPGRGTGLGLAVVHGIIQSHHGAIFATSTPGKGTLFEVFLPAATPALIGLTATDDGPPPSGHGEHVLLVEDDPVALTGLKGQLEHLGYHVTAFSGSRTALLQFIATPDKFRLILTDYAMPDLSGIDLAKKVQLARPGFPVILMSGYIETAQIDQAAAAGVKEVVRKPIGHAELGRLIARHLAPHPTR